MLAPAKPRPPRTADRALGRPDFSRPPEQPPGRPLPLTRFLAKRGAGAIAKSWETAPRSLELAPHPRHFTAPEGPQASGYRVSSAVALLTAARRSHDMLC